MKRIFAWLVAFCLLGTVSAEAWTNPYVVGGGAAGTPEGAYYYGSGLTIDDYTSTGGYGASDFGGDDIPLTGITGTVTKVGVKSATTATIECRVWDADGNLLGCGTISAGGDVFVDSGAMSGSVSNETIKVLCGSTGNKSFYRAAEAGGLYGGSLFTVGGECTGNNPSTSNYMQVGVRVYVE